MCNRIRHKGGDGGTHPLCSSLLNYRLAWIMLHTGSLSVDLEVLSQGVCMTAVGPPIMTQTLILRGLIAWSWHTSTHPTWNDMARSSCHQPGFPDGILLCLPRQSLFFEYKELFFILRPFLLNLLLLIFNLCIFNWRIIAWQYCVGFCHISTWISHRYTDVPSVMNLPPISHPVSGCHRVLGCMSSMHHTANSH